MNPDLLGCATTLAREYHGLACRIAGQRGADMHPTWDELTYDEREFATRIMYAALYRGLVVCPLPEHRIRVGPR